MSFTKVKSPVFAGGRKWGVCAGGVRKVIGAERRPKAQRKPEVGRQKGGDLRMSHREGSGLSLGRPRGCVVRGARAGQSSPCLPPGLDFVLLPLQIVLAHPADSPLLALQVQLHRMSLAH